jgi:hypothetical protein
MTIRKCNMCGEEILEDVDVALSIKQNCGYNSKYDLNKLDLDLCYTCFDNLMDYLNNNCKITPIIINH